MDENSRRRILFLDDRSKRIHSALKRFSHDDLTIVATVVECLRFISNEDWDVIYLDHDLGGGEFCDPKSTTCGMEVIRYIEKTEWPPEKKRPAFVIHSSNSLAATKMEKALKKQGFEVMRMRWEYA